MCGLGIRINGNTRVLSERVVWEDSVSMDRMTYKWIHNNNTVKIRKFSINIVVGKWNIVSFFDGVSAPNAFILFNKPLIKTRLVCIIFASRT